MEIENVNTGVETPAEVSVTESPAVETTETVSSPEVKEESIKTESVDPAKIMEQVNNLNIALKQEREAKRAMEESFNAKLAESQGTFDKLKQVFVPEQPAPQSEAPRPLTQEEMENFWKAKEQEKIEEFERKQREDAIRKEVDRMTTEWDGSDGKPKYDDTEVLQWQQANNKLYLSPSDAFREMKFNDILDYEVNKRLTAKPEVKTTERPGGSTEIREPAKQTLKTDAEIAQAVKDAINNAMAE